MDTNQEFVKMITEKVIEVLREKNAVPVNNTKNHLIIKELGEAKSSLSPDEVVVGLGASFSKDMFETISGIAHYDLVREVSAGIEEEGMKVRFVRVLSTSDVAFIALSAAKLSGSGIGIGIQSKGTTVIHQKDLYPLTNLELFPQAPLISLDIYRKIGKNAARYAKGQSPEPISVMNDCMIRPKFQAKAAVLHIKETSNLSDGATPVGLEVSYGD